MSGFHSERVAAGPSTLLEKMKTSSVKAGPMLPLTKEKFELITFATEMSYAVQFIDCDNPLNVCLSDFYNDDEVEYLVDSKNVDAAF